MPTKKLFEYLPWDWYMTEKMYGVVQLAVIGGINW